MVSDGLLDGLPVIDLADRRGEVGAYLLARLGADVIRIVPDPADRVEPEDALADLAYNSVKRQVRLDPTRPADRDRLRELVTDTAVVFDAGPPSVATGFGLGRAEIGRLNPGVVMVTITPFGIDGPAADDPASELTVAARGGPVGLQGVPDRAPLGFSLPQTWRHAGAEAAVAAMMARARQRRVGGPQFVDVSAQSVMTWTMLNAMEAHEVQGRDFERTGAVLRLAMTIPLLRECRDGHVVLVPRGPNGGRLTEWMIEDGVLDAEESEAWRGQDWARWDNRIIEGSATSVTHPELIDAMDRLCRRYTKAELLDRGLEVGVTIAPVNDLGDLLRFEHLRDRRFWEGPAGGAREDEGSALRPGAFVTVDGHRPRRRARVGAEAAPSPPGFLHPQVAGTAGENGGGSDRGLPLEGVRVADFSWIGVGPISAKSLADHGATVVRVESEHRVDGLRTQPPFTEGRAGLNRSNFFGTFNTSKQSLALDLKTEGGLRVANRLVEWADVVIDSFTPGTMDRLGLGPADIRSRNPEVITVTTSLLGCGSRYSTLAGYGYHAASIAGFFGLVGWSDLAPDGPWLAYTDTIGPRFIVPSILSALERRERTGLGCHLEAAQLEMALQFLAPELLDHQLNGHTASRDGNRDRRFAPQGVYRCDGDDRWVAVTVRHDEDWIGLCRLLGRSYWARDPTLTGESGLAGRAAAHDLIDEAVTAWTSSRSDNDAEAELMAAGIPAGAVQRSSDLLVDAQLRHRDFYRRLDHVETGSTPYAGHPYRIAGYDHGPRAAAPCLGQHTFEVLTDLLGFDVDEVAEIAATGALE